MVQNEVRRTTNIRAVVANVVVDDLEAAIPLYQELAGGEQPRRFEYQALSCALVGPFLLYAGPTEEYLAQAGTVLVESLDPVLAALESVGAELVEPVNEVPNGTRIVARHPDGAVFEYLQPRASAG